MTHLVTISANAASRLIPDVIYTFSEGWNQASSLARNCTATLGEIDIHRFPDGETLIKAAPLARTPGGVVAVYRSLHEPNAKLIELILAAAAVRDLGARKVVLIAPYLPYMRQDKAFAPGQATSQTVICQLLSTHFDAILTIEPHLHRTHSLESVFGDTPAISINAGAAIATHMREHGIPSTIVVGPDEESESLVREVVGSDGLCWFTANKQRLGDSKVNIELPTKLTIDGFPVVIVDDIVSTGTTAIALASELKKAGAGTITLYVVHALFDLRAMYQMQRAGISDIRSVSTVPHITNAISAVSLISAALGVRS